ncbi:histidine phosphatase family protein [Variovorax sp. DXTD-1]|uniref:histidine phosphatase family protein n=1 Tax=Variovorax sp. DXTD-1 TaxID=2495592 RepID=UPI000F87190A|nr:histidine phosphatase family protein [Variovorax sp. DXTD-1]RST50428.1 histidine phosphatase family protein [Variovorax sp. DXTD-1]
MNRAAVCMLLASALVLGCAPGSGQTDTGWGALRNGDVVLFRHAEAPGIGDPPGMRLDDCSTQRNLDDTGRKQARRIGERFRERGIAVSSVLTSEWCRARDTATLAFPAIKPRVDSAFNSLFSDRSREPEQSERARALLLAWRGPGVLVVTTHQANISALTGVALASGEGVVMRSRQGALAVVGTLPTDGR